MHNVSRETYNKFKIFLETSCIYLKNIIIFICAINVYINKNNAKILALFLFYLARRETNVREGDTLSFLYLGIVISNFEQSFILSLYSLLLKL